MQGRTMMAATVSNFSFTVAVVFSATFARAW